jgi:trans-2,3-dihydro-3-hydroxyanthranilate isomerase
MDLQYRVVDVFTQTPLEGNALAVFPDGRNVDSSTMQRIARELNLAEITFVLPATRSDCVAKVRIFTPTMEMLFAGHPTIGTSYVLRECGIASPQSRSFVLEENVGPVKVRLDEGDDPLIWLETPPISRSRSFAKCDAARAVGLQESDLLDVPVELWSAGNPNAYIAVRDRAAVDRAWVDLATQRALLGGEDPTCVFVFTPTAQGAYSRMFAPEHGVVEDPATGSATGPLAAYMMEHGLCSKRDGTQLISEQGVKMGRRSLLHILIHGEGGSAGIEVGGHVRPIARATMQL